MGKLRQRNPTDFGGVPLSFHTLTQDTLGLFLEIQTAVSVPLTHPATARRSGSLVYLTPMSLGKFKPMGVVLPCAVLILHGMSIRRPQNHSLLEDTLHLLSSPILVSFLFHRLFQLK